MRVLWITNQCIPVVAKHLNLEIGNKEGWLAGISERFLAEKVQDITLGICFPMPAEKADLKAEFEVTAYGYEDDRVRPEEYRENLEKRFGEIFEDFKPDVIHIFGTEYGHTLAAAKACKNPSKLLIGIQGLCGVYANHFTEGLPEKVIEAATLRDKLKNDNIKRQQEKYVIRGKYEEEALRITKNVTGRTDWDFEHTHRIQEGVNYYFMNETLRSNFYTGEWSFENCEPHSIFLSQGDYPIKGLHLLLDAMPEIVKKYPDTQVYVAGNKITGEESLKKKVLISSYGKYLKEQMKQYGVEEKIHFLGSLNAEQMKERFLKSNLFLSPSTIENSPNSVGEAMLLGLPVVSTDVGGVHNMLENGKEGILYPTTDTEKLADAICTVFAMNGKQEQKAMCSAAKEHAKKTHNADTNYARLLEIYKTITGGADSDAE